MSGWLKSKSQNEWWMYKPISNMSSQPLSSSRPKALTPCFLNWYELSHSQSITHAVCLVFTVKGHFRFLLYGKESISRLQPVKVKCRVILLLFHVIKYISISLLLRSFTTKSQRQRHFHSQMRSVTGKILWELIFKTITLRHFATQDSAALKRLKSSWMSREIS